MKKRFLVFKEEDNVAEEVVADQSSEEVSEETGEVAKEEAEA